MFETTFCFLLSNTYSHGQFQSISSVVISSWSKSSSNHWLHHFIAQSSQKRTSWWRSLTSTRTSRAPPWPPPTAARPRPVATSCPTSCAWGSSERGGWCCLGLKGMVVEMLLRSMIVNYTTCEYLWYVFLLLNIVYTLGMKPSVVDTVLVHQPSVETEKWENWNIDDIVKTFNHPSTWRYSYIYTLVRQLSHAWVSWIHCQRSWLFQGWPTFAPRPRQLEHRVMWREFVEENNNFVSGGRRWSIFYLCTCESVCWTESIHVQSSCHMCQQLLHGLGLVWCLNDPKRTRTGGLEPLWVHPVVGIPDGNQVIQWIKQGLAA